MNKRIINRIIKKSNQVGKDSILTLKIATVSINEGRYLISCELTENEPIGIGYRKIEKVCGSLKEANNDIEQLAILYPNNQQDIYVIYIDIPLQKEVDRFTKIEYEVIHRVS